MMSFPRVSFHVGVLLTLLFGVGRTSGTTMIPMSVEVMAEKADAVVHGVVARRSVSRHGDRLTTRVTLKVEEVLKGRVEGGEITISQAGGTLGERRTRVVGAPNFTVGSEVVVFLVFNKRGEGVVLGLAQGKFDVFADAAGRKQARNRFHGGRAAAKGSERALFNKLGGRPLTLDQLRGRVRARGK